jgi:hypothetical protein
MPRPSAGRAGAWAVACSTRCSPVFLPTASRLMAEQAPSVQGPMTSGPEAAEATAALAMIHLTVYRPADPNPIRLPMSCLWRLAVKQHVDETASEKIVTALSQTRRHYSQGRVAPRDLHRRLLAEQPWPAVGSYYRSTCDRFYSTDSSRS